MSYHSMGNQHDFGIRMEAEHMCPKCGYPPKAFCDVCLGVGTVDEATLMRFMYKLHIEGDNQ